MWVGWRSNPRLRLFRPLLNRLSYRPRRRQGPVFRDTGPCNSTVWCRSGQASTAVGANRPPALESCDEPIPVMRARFQAWITAGHRSLVSGGRRPRDRKLARLLAPPALLLPSQTRSSPGMFARMLVFSRSPFTRRMYRHSGARVEYRKVGFLITRNNNSSLSAPPCPRVPVS
jgi:hypothetical protein